MVNKEEVETLEKAKEELQDILSDIDDLLERAYNGEDLDKRDLDNILKRLEDVRDDLRELS
ncbi:hypothetical protein DDW11_01820 [Sulfolobus sp. SCGC AB-777_G06]|jgi:Holliday junction resolvase RusA-like endonuclease|uniref:hypothetical protein n=1 Tax=unclassified Stygiolobus TaxID=2824672 RepID=UPI000D563E9A|nr:hypothetical protein [Sulfolobaceae archaeon]PVU75715.1 hypothetical protein DDW11_01820 [Sulfolobus sp. SCGC AB-777_G06]